jgi:hypothetical protein
MRRLAIVIAIAVTVACNSIVGIEPATVREAGTDDAASGEGGDVDATDDGGAVYHDMTQADFWDTYDMTYAIPNARGFRGCAFDGTYVYFVPYNNGSYDGLVVRYDTRADFKAKASWEAFDTAAQVDPNALGFSGAVYDGHYLYLIPFAEPTDGPAVPSRTATRYDTHAPFTDKSSWATFDTSTIDARARGFWGGTYAGHYVYFVPGWYASFATVATRYDTLKPFGDRSSWETFDVTTLDPNASGYFGAVFDGKYVYFANGNVAGHSVTLRYDTTGPFGSGGSWDTFNTGLAFLGVAFDGQHVYFVPAGSSQALRYDTQASWSSPSSWNAFDVQKTVDPNVLEFYGAGFDGRYVYLLPDVDKLANFSGSVARVDTQRAFDDKASWQVYDTTSKDFKARGFAGAAFDGRYLYLVPGTCEGCGGLRGQGRSVVARFDAKTPQSMPPGFSGSFW